MGFKQRTAKDRFSHALPQCGGDAVCYARGFS